MPYVILNLTATRHDPFKRGHKVPLARRNVRIGLRQLQPGQRVTISDAVYANFKTIIDQYVQYGMVRMTRLNDQSSRVDDVTLETPSNEYTDAATDNAVPSLPELAAVDLHSTDVLLGSTTDTPSADADSVAADSTPLEDKAAVVEVAAIEAAPESPVVARKAPAAVVAPVEVAPVKRRPHSSKN